MPSKVHKAIITNRSALQRKYGTSLGKIDRAILDLIAADKSRGLTTAVIDVADAATMKLHRDKPVTIPTDAPQNKTAIDKIYRSLMPDYLMILGAIDVIPHQDLHNPLYDADDPTGDPDSVAFSDLPYACDRPYSQNIEEFTGPTRVVGRLPDVLGGTDANYLVGLLDTAASYKSRLRLDYDSCLCISARVWKVSTDLSLRAILGSAGRVQNSPPKGPRWPARLLNARTHFINCHGAPADPHFYGQQGNNFPIAHDAAHVMGRLSDGTVCSAECCYGAELYDPIGTGAGQAGMCNAYLGSKAYGYFGSSTVAYGPVDKNAQADLIAQDFLRHVLAGASTGRAALQARQGFVLKAGLLDPFDLKTLAQFSLMGDPSVHPVQSMPSDDAVILTRSLRGSSVDAINLLTGLSLRRDTLRKNGLAIAQAANSIVSASRKAAPPKIRQAITGLMREAPPVSVFTFAVRPSAITERQARRLAKSTSARAQIHVATSTLKVSNAPIPQLVGVAARELNGTLTLRKLFSR